MKKVVLLISLLACFLFTGCNNKTYDEISYDEYKNMVKTKETFVLYIGSSKCNHCRAYTETINRVIKDYDVDVKYINILDMTEKQYNEFKSQISFMGTPTTIFLKNGKEESHYNRIVGAQEYDKVVNKFKQNGYIEVKE